MNKHVKLHDKIVPVVVDSLSHWPKSLFLISLNLTMITLNIMHSHIKKTSSSFGPWYLTEVFRGLFVTMVSKMYAQKCSK